MNTKLLELRDSGTFIPLLCVDMNPGLSLTSVREVDSHAAQTYLLRRCGYPCNGRPNIAITKLSADGDRCSNDPYYWGDRTRATGHRYIIEHWDELKDGDVVDVEYILGETATKKISERVG